jgi:hypothetical protein
MDIHRPKVAKESTRSTNVEIQQVWRTRYNRNHYGGRYIHYKIDTGNDGYGDLRFVSDIMMELLRNAQVIKDKFIVSSGIGLLWI